MARMGQLSAFLEVAGNSFQLSMALSTYSRNKFVPSDVHELARTLTSFALVLRKSVALFQTQKSTCTGEVVDTAQRMLQHCAGAFDEIDDMLDDAQDVPAAEAESAASSREYVETCFETKRVQYLLAYLRCLELNLDLILQVIEVGKKLELVSNSKNEEQRNVNVLVAGQEWIVAQDVLLVRQRQLEQVNRSWSAWLAQAEASKQDAGNLLSPETPTSDDKMKSMWIGLPKLGHVEDKLQALFVSEEDIGSITQGAVSSMLGEWTTLQLDSEGQPIATPKIPDDTNSETSELYESDEDFQIADDPRDDRRKPIPVRLRKPRRESRTRREYSDDEYETDSSRRRPSHHRKPSFRSETSSTSRYGRYERRGSSDWGHGRRPTSHLSERSSQERPSRSKRKHDEKSEQKSDDRKPSRSDDKKQDDKPEDDGGKNGKEQEADEGSKDDDTKDSSGGVLGGLGHIPVSALLMPTLLKFLNPEAGKENDKNDSDKKPDGGPNVPAAQSAASVLPPKPPSISPRIGTAQLAPGGANTQQSYANRPGQTLPPNPSAGSTAAQKYTPHGASSPGPRQSAAGVGNSPVSHHHAQPPATQYAAHDPYAPSHRPAQLQRPPSDRYGPNRSPSPRPHGHETPSTHHDDRRDTRRPQGSPGRPAVPYDRLASPHRAASPHSSQHHPHARPYDDRPQPPQSARYHRPSYPYDDRDRRHGLLSPDDTRGRRSSMPNERMQSHSPGLADRYGQRPSRSPPRRHDYDRPPTRESRRRESSPRGRRPDSWERRPHVFDAPRRSSRPASRPPSRIRPTSASGRTYGSKTSAGRAKTKRADAQAASRVLSSLALGSGLFKGLGMLGKVRR